MTLTALKLKTLENKYGMYASWAIWNSDPSIKMDTSDHYGSCSAIAYLGGHGGAQYI